MLREVQCDAAAELVAVCCLVVAYSTQLKLMKRIGNRELRQGRVASCAYPRQSVVRVTIAHHLVREVSNLEREKDQEIGSLDQLVCCSKS